MSEPRPPAAPLSTAQRVLRSTVAAYGIQLARLLVGFAAKLVLARLVLPEGHGLYELALRIVTVAAACRDLGLPYHLVRDPRRPYGTVFAATATLGAAITALLVLGAPLSGVLDADLPAVLRALAAWVLLDGLAVVPKAYFERELDIGRLLAPEVWRGVVVAVVAVALAWRGYGVWSFVVADLVGAALLATWSWWRAWGRVPLQVEWRLLPDLVRQSSVLFAIWLALQLVTYVDVYIVDVFRDTATVGLYARAYLIAFLMATIAYPRALFPTLVAYRDDPPRFLEVFRLGMVQLLGCQVLASYFLLLNAERVVAILLGPAWSGAAPILRVLAFVPFLDQFTIVGGEMLKARHQDRAWLAVMLLNLASLLACGIWLTARRGAVGMAAANYLLVGNLLMAWLVWRVFGPAFRRLVGDLLRLYLVPLPLFAAAWLLPAGSWARFAASGAAAAIAAAVLLRRYREPFRLFFAGPPSPQ
jgi:O-antigen/teichoic acid export membrane protein